MTLREKVLHSLMLSVTFSLVNWKIIDFFLIDMPFWRYIIIELILVISIKLFKFTKQKLKIDD